MPEIEARLAQVENRLERVEAKVDDVAGRVDGLAHGLQKLDTSVGKLEINSEGTRDDLKQLAEGLVATQNLIARRADQILAKLAERFGPVKAAVRQSAEGAKAGRVT